ncbi:MAG: hypothetical protein ACI8QF_004588 [Limisphaerales bacterium]|jgi:hypothetical protein
MTLWAVIAARASWTAVVLHRFFRGVRLGPISRHWDLGNPSVYESGRGLPQSRTLPRSWALLETQWV